MANYKIGSIGNLISGKTTGDVETKKIVFQELAPKPKVKDSKKVFSEQVNNSNQSSDGQLSVQKKVSPKKKTLLQKGQKLKNKVAASVLRKKKAEIAGDDVSKPVGLSYNLGNSEDSTEVDGLESQKDNAFSRNAARRVHIKNNTRKHIDDPEKNSRTVFVGNVPLVHSKKLHKFFSKYGVVESVRLRCAPLDDPRVSKKVAVIKNKFHPQRSSINAFVVFKTSDNAKSALEANGTVFHDHHLRVDLAKTVDRKQVDSRKSIFVGNLNFAAEEEDLWKLFAECGPIESVRIVRDRITSVSKGIAYVNFQTADAAELALHLDGSPVKKRNILVQRFRASADSSLKKSVTDKSVRHKTLDENAKSKAKFNDEIRMAKKSKRKMRRENEKLLGIVKKKKKVDSGEPNDSQSKESVSELEEPKQHSGMTDKLTKEAVSGSNENQASKSVKGRYQGQTVEESKKKKKKKINQGVLKKKKIALMLSGEKKKKKEVAPVSNGEKKMKKIGSLQSSKTKIKKIGSLLKDKEKNKKV